MSGLIFELRRVWVGGRFLDLLEKHMVEFGVSVV